ncbi:retrotransposon-related protein, partial [Trifolium pratense]
MPSKKITPAAFSKMEARVENLEGEITEIRSTLVDVQKTMKESHANLIAMMERCLGKSTVVDEGSASIVAKTIPANQISSGKEKGMSSGGLHGEALTEFRHSVKRVELPSFDGEDPAGWISRAEVYFRVQGTMPEVKVSLAQLCMDGATIHFFNSLLREDEDLTWEGLKEALLER